MSTNDQCRLFVVIRRFASFVDWYQLNKFYNECDDEGVDRDSFREGDSQNHGCLDLRGCFRIAADSFHRFAGEHTDTDTRADSAKTDGERCRKGGEAICLACYFNC